jgi:hypothetical protein
MQAIWAKRWVVCRAQTARLNPPAWLEIRNRVLTEGADNHRTGHDRVRLLALSHLELESSTIAAPDSTLAVG